MHSTAQQTMTPAGPPTGRGRNRARRITAILAIGALPLMAAACATPAGTSSGAGRAASGTSSTQEPSVSPSVSGSESPSVSGSEAPTQPPSGSSSGASVPDALLGSAYRSTSIKGRQAVKGSPLQISFDSTGERSGLHAGCNSMGGAPLFDGDTLSIQQIVSTMMACEAGGGVIMKQESWYSKWLTEGVGYAVDGSTLTLEAAGVTVVFERSGDADAPPSSSSADPAASTSDDGATTQAETGPVATPGTPLPGATIVPGTRGSAIPIPPTTR